MTENRSTILAAALILLGFGLFAYFLPRIMLAAMEISPWAAGAVVVIFIFALFGIFWLRGRSRH